MTDTMTRILAFFAFLTLTACTMTQHPIGNPEQPYTPKTAPTVGDILHMPTGHYVNTEAMLAAVVDARIVYVGETHDNPASHRLQLQVLEAVAGNHPQQVSLGMEMFNHEQQPVLDDWIAGTLSEKEFLKQANWYSVWTQDFSYYRDILLYARDHQIPVIGLNISKEFRRKIAMTAIDQLDAETRDKLPEMDFADPYQKAMAEAIFAGHSNGSKMLDSFLRVQTLWDEAMAETIVQELTTRDAGQRMVVMAGGNHVRYGFGIPRRVHRRLPTSYLLVGNRELEIPVEKQESLMDVDLPHLPMPPYDYLAYTKYESLPGKRVKLGVRMNDESGQVVVENVVISSTADRSGVQAGDVLVSLDGVLLKDNFDLVYEISQRTEGDQAILIVEREQKQLTLNVTFTPLPKTDGLSRGDDHKK